MDEDKTVTATFAPTTYTVTFNLDGGTRTGGGALSQTVAHGGSATAPTVAPPAGYEFSHWEGSYTNVTSDRTITAQYERKSYTVTFDLDGKGTRSGGGQLSQTVQHGHRDTNGCMYATGRDGSAMGV